MGSVIVNVAGSWVPAASYSISEHGIPTYAGETTGGVGSATITMPSGRVNPNTLKGRSYEIIDEEKGTSGGTIVAVSESNGMVTLSCLPRLVRLNIFNVRAEPYGGTLAGAFNKYLDLGKVPVASRRISAEASKINVSIPGWYGELWLHLKQLATAYGFDIQTAGNQIILEPMRVRTMEAMAVMDKSSAWNPVSKATKVEVYRYDAQWVEDYPFYPHNVSDSNVVNLKAGEPTTTQIELRGSVKNFIETGPTRKYARTIIPSYDEKLPVDATTKSSFCLTYGDGTRVTYKQFVNGGGRLKVILNPDSFTATVVGVGPVGVISKQGETVETFNVAIVSGGITYDALRLRGQGTRVWKTKRTFLTGVDSLEAETDVGVTVDNIFLSTHDQVSNAAVDASTFSSGGRWETSATLDGMIRKVGDRAEGDQIIGTMGGLRFFDERSSSFFRVRKASISVDRIDVESADLDNCFGDFKQAYSEAATYADVRADFEGMTYEQQRATGLPRITSGILG